MKIWPMPFFFLKRALVFSLSLSSRSVHSFAFSLYLGRGALAREGRVPKCSRVLLLEEGLHAVVAVTVAITSINAASFVQRRVVYVVRCAPPLQPHRATLARRPHWRRAEASGRERENEAKTKEKGEMKERNCARSGKKKLASKKKVYVKLDVTWR